MTDHLSLAKTLARIEIPETTLEAVEFDWAIRTATAHTLIAIAERLPKPEPASDPTAADRLAEVQRLVEYAELAGQSVLAIAAVREALGGNDTGVTPSPSDGQPPATRYVELSSDELSRFSADARRCTSDVTLRDEEHRLVRCWLPAGHEGDHTDHHGVTWTGGER